jgi:hypothetical protein
MLRMLCHPFFVAALITAVNATKPVAVDDTAYLTFARHIAGHPFDPYGFEQFWSDVPQPAMDVLAPPVLPYWLGLGIAIFGEHEVILKLWLFPFAALLTYSLRSLGQRFGTSEEIVPLVGLSGLVLPLFGFMLDIPATALSLASLAVFANGMRGSTIYAGIFAALAMQTKYTAIVLPSVIGWYGLVNGRTKDAVLTVLVAVSLFALWEYGLILKYGESHFLHHAAGESGTDGWLGSKTKLAMPLVSYLGGLGIGIVLFAACLHGRRFLAWGVAMFAVLSFVLVAVLPEKPSLAVARVAFPVLGGLFLFAPELALGNKGGSMATRRFLFGWLILELIAYFVLTPFSAGRRVIGCGIAAAFCVALKKEGAVYAGMSRVWLVGPLLGFLLAGIDSWDARAERDVAIQSEQYLNGKGGTVWFNGHWGFQYYCEQAGMRPVVPDRSKLVPGDWLVFPAVPDDEGFYRPFHGWAKFVPDPSCLVKETEFIADDWLSGTTIPTLYGGGYPLLGRNHPRLRVVIYRVTVEYAPVKVP